MLTAVVSVHTYMFKLVSLSHFLSFLIRATYCSVRFIVPFVVYATTLVIQVSLFCNMKERLQR